tara:strand:- start:848 stop:1453 length:606 start_codon:yes stop_codon:yes gene_type:complete
MKFNMSSAYVTRQTTGADTQKAYAHFKRSHFGGNLFAYEWTHELPYGLQAVWYPDGAFSDGDGETPELLIFDKDDAAREAPVFREACKLLEDAMFRMEEAVVVIAARKSIAAALSDDPPEDWRESLADASNALAYEFGLDLHECSGTYNCQACNVPNAGEWIAIEDCGATIVCVDCLTDLGDDRAKEAFYNLPHTREVQNG